MDTARTLESGVVRDFLRDLVQVDRPGTRPPPFETVMEEIHQLGVEPGTPVMVAMPNGAPFVTVVCALLVRARCRCSCRRRRRRPVSSGWHGPSARTP